MSKKYIVRDIRCFCFRNVIHIGLVILDYRYWLEIQLDSDSQINTHSTEEGN